MAHKKAIKVGNTVLIKSNKDVLRVDTIQKFLPTKLSGYNKDGLIFDRTQVKQGMLVISGISTARSTLTLGSQSYIQGHKYLARSGIKGFGKETDYNNDNPHFFINYGYFAFEIDKPKIFTATATGDRYNTLYYSAGVDLTTPMPIRFQLYDLTEIFGEGNEPSTVEEAESLLGKSYIPYQYLASYKRNLVVKTSQKVENGDFKKTTGWSVYGATAKFDTNAGILTLTPTTVGTSNKYFEFYKNIGASIVGHKYFVSFYYKTDKELASDTRTTYGGVRIATLTGELNKWNKVAGIITSVRAVALLDTFFVFTNEVGTVNVQRVSCIDLTETFGEGNEPTTVEEAEAILGKGYIPYQYL